MKFHARLALVNVKAGNKPDAPVEINLKLEPLYLDDPGWLCERVGESMVVEMTPGVALRTPLEEAIDAVNGR